MQPAYDGQTGKKNERQDTDKSEQWTGLTARGAAVQERHQYPERTRQAHEDNSQEFTLEIQDL